MADKKFRNPFKRFLKAFLLTVIVSVTVMFVAINFFDLSICY